MGVRLAICHTLSRMTLSPLRYLGRERRRLGHKDASPAIRQDGEEDHLPGVVDGRALS